VVTEELENENDDEDVAEGEEGEEKLGSMSCFMHGEDDEVE